MNLAASIQERFQGMLPELLGMELTEVTPERAVATMLVRPDLCTVGGTLHGGAIMAFADTLGAVGTVVNLPAGARTVTIESKTNFIGGAPVGTQVTGEATPLHKGRTTMVWQTRISSQTGKLVALVTQTQMVIAGPAAA
jgi:1,4-dihydroxy-2-naphthoyl-CoA hydrolase